MPVGCDGGAGGRGRGGCDKKRGRAREGRGIMEGVRRGRAGTIVPVCGVEQGRGVEQRRVRVTESDFGIVGKGHRKGRERWNGGRRRGEVYTRQALRGRKYI